MDWREKWAVLKMAGFKMVDYGTDRAVGEGKYFRYGCELDPWQFGAGDTKAEAVEKAWIQYEREITNEKAS